MSRDRNYLYWLILGGLLFLPGLGSTHLFDWDEINFAECAREMIVSVNYSQMQIAFKPFWEKPPSFIWLQVLSMKMFGINEFAARLPNALIGIVALLLLYFLGKHLYQKRTGLLWAALYAGSYLSFFYFKSGIIDPLYNLTMFLAIVFIALYYNFKHLKYIVWSGLITGIAIMTKGPVAWLIVGLTWFIYLLLDRKVSIKTFGHIILWFTLSLSITSIWFGYESWRNGPWLVTTFIEYQIRLLTTPDAGHGGFLLYHWVILLVGMLPASVYMIAFLLKEKFSRQDSFTKMMMISFWVVLVVFTLVKTKIVHYSSFAYYPITFLAARYITHSNPLHMLNLKRMFRIASAALVIMAIVVIGFIYLASHPDRLITLIKDDFVREALGVQVHWPLWLYFIPIVFILMQAYLNINRLLIDRYAIQSFLNAFYLMLLMITIVPRVEAISQGSYIKMCQEIADKDAILLPYGFKSYAHLFYGNQSPQHCRYTTDELLSGIPAGFDTYFICKKGKETELQTQPGLHLIRQEGGYYLFRLVDAGGHIHDFRE